MATHLTSPYRSKSFRTNALAICVLLVSGCASFSQDGGFGYVEKTTAEILGKEVSWNKDQSARSETDKRIQSLLEKPLTVEDAVQIALLNNRGLQASFDTLGITEAQRVQAGRFPNPGFSIEKTRRGDEREIERGFHINLARLIFMPTVLKMEARRFERVQRDVAISVLKLAGQTRKAWLEAVSAKETAAYTDRVKRTADVGAQLARRMEKIGNFSKLQQAREQSFYADATTNLVRARNVEMVAREKLTRLLGLYGSQVDFQLPVRLPSLPEQVDAYTGAVKTALSQRLDVQAARIGVEQIATNLGMVKTNRFFNVLEVGIVHNSSNEAPRQTGWEVGLELPIFDWGDAKVAKADAIYRQALNRAVQIAIDARSEVRQAYGGYRSAFDIAAHYRDEVVPLRQRISEENQYRYNGMMIGVFELLADARSQIGAVNQYILALRDFWVAKADLDMAMIGKPSLSEMGGVMTDGAAEAGGH